MEWSQSSQEQHDPFTWFKESQLQSVFRNGSVPDWFHGIISRKTAEELLVSKPPGYFLIRVSESRIGYTLSYRADDRCRHFMIDTLVDGQYMIVGENRRHRSLQDLVEFHRRTPIMPFNQILTVACGQSSSSHADYAQLLFPIRHQTSDTSSPTKDPQDEIPPTLPYRPNNLRDSTVLLPSSQPSGLYPSLELEFHHVTAPPPTSPVAKTRKRVEVNNLPSNQPPEVPSRSWVPQKQNQPIVRAIPVPRSSFTPSAHPQNLATNAQPVRFHHEWKPSVVPNFRSLKKKFQKKTSQPQDATGADNVYSEIHLSPGDRSEDTENEYQEITGQPTPGAAAHHSTLMGLTHQVLPQEYQSPPPFAPGY
ncbi:hematopoietic SH2 domain-containing protein homolog [Kryptolebias marmoratus]|uniref:Hematopoietic SH2 domain containing n=1 Tax=Kryptolebias marmoratus TaxID=37003 RepID=A0A3Q3H3N5_KRYMA|nr:hematopoietic SH2 domain-containing protein homolog [Kryptolebias marmoratus]XP_037830228.1 hematopoietic SH2 domain-containing protein homolog [Kryptolebias marmoratus]